MAINDVFCVLSKGLRYDRDRVIWRRKKEKYYFVVVVVVFFSSFFLRVNEQDEFMDGNYCAIKIIHSWNFMCASESRRSEWRVISSRSGNWEILWKEWRFSYPRSLSRLAAHTAEIGELWIYVDKVEELLSDYSSCLPQRVTHSRIIIVYVCTANNFFFFDLTMRILEIARPTITASRA